MQGRALLIGNGMQHGLGIECLTGEDDLGAMGNNSQHTKNQAKTVEEWRGAAEDVKRREVHAIADEAGVVDQVAAWGG